MNWRFLMNVMVISWLIFLGLSCARNPKDVKTIVEFISEEEVDIDGHRYPLRSRKDAFVIRKDFRRSWNFYFKGIEKTNFKSLWMFADDWIPRCNDAPIDSSFIAPNFGIVTRSGKMFPIRFGFRKQDLDARRHRDERYARQKVFTIDLLGLRPDSHSLSDINRESVKDTFMELWCGRASREKPMSGREIEEAVEQYCKFAAEDADVYLIYLPPHVAYQD